MGFYSFVIPDDDLTPLTPAQVTEAFEEMGEPVFFRLLGGEGSAVPGGFRSWVIGSHTGGAVFWGRHARLPLPSSEEMGLITGEAKRRLDAHRSRSHGNGVALFRYLRADGRVIEHEAK